MLKKGNEWMLLLFVCFTVLLVPFFSDLYEKITGSPLGYGGWSDIGFGHSENIEGFLFSSAFVLTLGIILFMGKHRYWTLAVVFGLPSLLLLIIQSFGILIVDLCAALIAIILGESILLISGKMITKK